MSVEAGASLGWERWVGATGRHHRPRPLRPLGTGRADLRALRLHGRPTSSSRPRRPRRRDQRRRHRREVTAERVPRAEAAATTGSRRDAPPATRPADGHDADASRRASGPGRRGHRPSRRANAGPAASGPATRASGRRTPRSAATIAAPARLARRAHRLRGGGRRADRLRRGDRGGGLHRRLVWAWAARRWRRRS